LVFLLTVSSTCLAEIQLSSDSQISTEGYFVLSWQSDIDLPLTLEQSSTENFSDIKTISLPSEGSLTLTGFEDGSYFFRINSSAESSNTVSITVTHHDLSRAFSFFFLGLLLFVILLVSIFIGRNKVGAEHG
jgi:hypothetical protein